MGAGPVGSVKAARHSYLHVPDDGLEEAPQCAALPLHLVRLRSVGAAPIHLRQEENSNRAGRPPVRCGQGGGRAEERRLRGSREVPHLLHKLLVCGGVSSLRHVGAAQLRLDSTEVRSSLEGEREGRRERAWRGVEARACVAPAQHTAAFDVLGGEGGGAKLIISQQLNHTVRLSSTLPPSGPDGCGFESKGTSNFGKIFQRNS